MKRRLNETDRPGASTAGEKLYSVSVRSDEDAGEGTARNAQGEATVKVKSGTEQEAAGVA
jgi:hypothetical protein